MKKLLSVIMITLNAQELLQRSLSSVAKIADEIIVVDSGSNDKTIQIAKKFGSRIYSVKTKVLGRNRAKALSLARGKWILALDSDEIVPKSLGLEILKTIKSKSKNDAYFIYFQNHLFSRRLRYGGEDYKILRLFKRKNAYIKPLRVHEHVSVHSRNIGVLKNSIKHYSYRNLWQMYSKFTKYALADVQQRQLAGEDSSLAKIVLYPIHMFWARFVKDKGYRDGMFRIPLDLGFAYMEFLTYFLLAFKLR